MNLKHWAAGSTIIGGISLAAAGVFGAFDNEPVPPGLSAAALWKPEPLILPQMEMQVPDVVAITPDPMPELRSPASPLMTLADGSSPTIESLLDTWSHEIATGETLDAVLALAGFTATDRAEVSLALAAEFDLRRLRPGHAVDVVSTPGGQPRRVVLSVDDGVRIEATFGELMEARTIAPNPEQLTLAGTARIETSIFAALDEAGMPARFAVDLAQMLGGTVDFRRDLGGGETLRLMWREARVGEDLVGRPELAFAALELRDGLYEVTWPEDGTGRATIYLDGEMQRVFAQPVDGARLSSVFGRRVHPVFGNVRMHTGVDFAAAHGTPVRATAPGRVTFIGRRGGYGRVVEIAHGSDIMTRYAHLSAVPATLSIGRRVAAGDTIGQVGATGTATGPNLHYEVRIDGQPTDPLSDERLANAAELNVLEALALERLTEARTTLEKALADAAIEPTERL